MISKSKKVSWYTTASGSSLTEIYQVTGIQFAFLSAPRDGSRQCHTWVKCRDYLHDAVRTQLTGMTTQVFGFTFEKGVNPPVDLNKMRILVTSPSVSTAEQKADFRQKMKTSLSILHHFEKYANMPLSKAKELNPAGSDKSVIFEFVGPVAWLKAPALVSLYTFLIRLGNKNEELAEIKDEDDLKDKMQAMVKIYNDAKKTKYKNDNDVKYLRVLWPHLHNVVKNREVFRRPSAANKGFDTSFFEETPIGTFHDRSGILNLVRCQSPSDKLNKVMKKFLGNKKENCSK